MQFNIFVLICESLHFDKQNSSDLVQLNCKYFLCYYREFKNYLVKFVSLNIIITDTFNIQLFAKDKLRDNISQFHIYYQSLSILHNSFVGQSLYQSCMDRNL